MASRTPGIKPAVAAPAASPCSSRGSATTPPRWRSSWTLSSLLVLLLLVFLPSASAWEHLDNLYCGKKNCYNILGVPENADTSEIKKTYRRLSLALHPDKNPSPKAASQFHDLTAAYKTLGDSKTREAYDYYLKHPDSYYAFYYGLRAVYPSQSNPFLVIFLCLLFVSVGQVVNYYWRKNYVRRLVTQQVQFKRAVDAALTNRHGVKYKKLPEEEQQRLRGEVEDELMRTQVTVDGSALSLSDGPLDMLSQLAVVSFFTAPFRLVVWSTKEASWSYRHTIRKDSILEEEREEATWRALGLDHAKWQRVDEKMQRALVEKELWHPRNLIIHRREAEEEARTKRMSSGRYKQMMRWRKKNPDTTYMMGGDD
eukprot:GHVU01040857.1.p1 GENE.GHVU01040857.1~~GHVU01040857.1.p1  ORF type:complete len:369 (+),score=96.41 GHVU01040857.1:724-1830(+)